MAAPRRALFLFAFCICVLAGRANGSLSFGGLTFSPIQARAVPVDPVLCRARLNPPLDGRQCGFQGNPDMYGLGLRLGIYFQWFACILSLSFVRKPEKDLPDASLVYSFAIALAMIITAFQDTCVYFVEAFILINIAFGGTLHLDLTKWEKGGWRRPALMAFYLTVFPYSCWFWKEGMKEHFSDTPCGTVLFLFGRISGSHVHIVLTVFLVFSIILTIVIGYSSIISLVVAVLDRMGKKTPAGLWQLSRRKTGVQSKEMTPLTWLVFALLMAYMTYIILAIEYTIKWNNVTGINSLGSVGQFFPFIISVLNLLRVLSSMINETKRKMKGEPLEGKDCATDLELSTKKSMDGSNVDAVSRGEMGLVFDNDTRTGPGNKMGEVHVEERNTTLGRSSGFDEHPITIAEESGSRSWVR